MWLNVDFIAGFISGVAGLIVGSPLDVLKTQRQAASRHREDAPRSSLSLSRPTTWFSGLLGPLLGLGLQNAILFWSYEGFLRFFQSRSLILCFLAGGFSGLCVFFVSCPTEVIKVRAQTSRLSSLHVIRLLLQRQWQGGLWQASPFLQGGTVTLLRDAIGYGFYFIAFEVLQPWLSHALLGCAGSKEASEMGATLLAGGVAGCLSWFSIFPLDTVKTRLQAHSTLKENPVEEEEALLAVAQGVRPVSSRGILTCMQQIMLERAMEDGFSPGSFRATLQGVTGLYAGLGAAMLRAFIVNAVLFATDKGMKDALT